MFGLANLLPGLREVRAPLAAGYLWLLAAWLVFHEEPALTGERSQTVQDVLELKAELGDAALVAGISFAAYVVGALWEPVAGYLARAARTVVIEIRESVRPGPSLFARKRLRLKDRRLRRVTEPPPPIWLWLQSYRRRRIPLSPGARAQLEAFVDRESSRITEILSDRRLGSENAEGTADVEACVLEAQELLEADDADSEPKLEVVQMRFQESAYGSERARWWSEQPDAQGAWANVFDLARWQIWRDYERERGRYSTVGDAEPLALWKPAGFPALRVTTHQMLQVRILQELPSTARRLVGEEQESYLEASRMKAEVEFRYAISVPLAIVVAVAGAGLDLNAGNAVIGFAAGLVGLALTADGWRRDRERNDLLVQLLEIGQAKSPALERLLERANQAKPYSEEERPLATASDAETDSAA